MLQLLHVTKCLAHRYLTHFYNAQRKSRLSERRAEYNTSYPERERFRWRQNCPFRWFLFDCAKAMQWPPHCIALTSSFVVFCQPQKQRNNNVKIFYHEIWRIGFFSLTLPCTWEGTWRVKAAAQHSSSELGSALALHFTCCAIPRKEEAGEPEKVKR